MICKIFYFIIYCRKLLFELKKNVSIKYLGKF